MQGMRGRKRTLSRSRVFADRIEHGEAGPDLLRIPFKAASFAFPRRLSSHMIRPFPLESDALQDCSSAIVSSIATSGQGTRFELASTMNELPF